MDPKTIKILWWAGFALIIAFVISVIVLLITNYLKDDLPKASSTPIPSRTKDGAYDTTIKNIASIEGMVSDTLPKEIQNRSPSVIVLPCHGTGQKLRWSSVGSMARESPEIDSMNAIRSAI